MNIIYGELIPIDKSVRLNGTSLVDGYNFYKDIKYLPQFQFIPKFLTIKRIFQDFEIDFIDFINEFPEFKKFYKSKIGNLSGGERRIIEIYLIMTSNTKFCMLDEPFSHIMPVHVETIKKLILKEKNNKGIFITDHLYREIIDIFDNLYIIKDGKTYLTKSLQDIETLGYAKINSY